MLKIILILISTLIFFVVIIRLLVTAFQQSNENKFHKIIPKTIRLNSSAFENNGFIPIDYTPKKNDNSPPLTWENIPKETLSFVLLMFDYDAPAPFFKLMTINHWVVYNIPPTIVSIKSSITTEELNEIGISVGLNISGKNSYTGPEPPIGIHSYYFRIYALSIVKLNVDIETKDAVMKAMNGNILAYGELIGKF
jgi:Raf kinase inhibitor-like YbhB/YbcL family protein